MSGPLGDQDYYNNMVINNGKAVVANVRGASPYNMSAFGLEFWAQPVAVGWSLFAAANSKPSSLPATFILGGGSVDVDFGSGVVAQMPALYATVFKPTDGSAPSVLLSNKGSDATLVDVTSASSAAIRSVTTVSADDPFTVHNGPHTAVDHNGNTVPLVVPVVQFGGNAGAVLVPANGVVLVAFAS